MGFFKWLYPGMRIKRWVFLCALGMILLSMGFVLAIIEENREAGSLVVVVGIFFVIVSIRKIIKSVVTVILPEQNGNLLNLMYQKRHLERGLKIVAIGGGSGLSVFLHGIKEYTSNITAVVTVADDGGSSGRLREQFDVLPPGDIRNCLVALADTEPLMRDLFQYRFQEDGSGLSGHSFGNLFILALSKVAGDFEKAVKESSKILAIRGQVVPSTLKKVVLVARHENGQETQGESNITKVKSRIERVFLRPEHCSASDDALEAIEEADAIVIGPGSLYTSILPNLLIEELSAAISKSLVPKIYVCNAMTQPFETYGLSAFDHVNAIVNHTRPEIITHCIVNNGKIPDKILERYREEEADRVTPDTEAIKSLGYRVVEADVVSTTDYVRHHSGKLARSVIDIIHQSRQRHKRSTLVPIK